MRFAFDPESIYLLRCSEKEVITFVFLTTLFDVDNYKNTESYENCNERKRE